MGTSKFLFLGIVCSAATALSLALSPAIPSEALTGSGSEARTQPDSEVLARSDPEARRRPDSEVLARSDTEAPTPSGSEGRTQSGSDAPNGLHFTLKALGHNVFAAIDNAKGEAGANAGFVIGDDGVAVIDSFENPDAAKQLLAEIKKLTPLPVKFLINTHYHLDHVAGNRVFQEAGAVIFAQRNVPAWIHTENLKFFGKNIKPEQKALVENIAGPDVVYDSGVTLFLGKRRIEVHVFPGHTGGDSIVFIPDAPAVFCGDLFWKKTLPNLIDASTEKWIPTLAAIAELSPSADFIPGHGDVGKSQDVKDFRQYLMDLREMAAGPVKDGKKGDDLVAAVLPGLTQKYGEWSFFKFFAKPDILNAGAELRGEKKNPVPESSLAAHP
ncbi:MAG TPA: MBL fold metallo-hydrolase [Candidatus Acidoferrum sp.]|jgi:glyoxylase-like metal-dependent hydrolase (beta-lactamase superfamily II)